MLTRRDDLTKCGAGLAAIIAAGKDPAAIVRSMVGASGAMSIGSTEWKNPYVTDGLVGLFDGEWNAGPGKHDSSRNIVNIVTGDPISLDAATYPQNVTLGSNYIDVVKPCTLVVDSLRRQLSDPATRTFEIVFQTISLNKTSQWCRAGWIDCGVVINYASTNHASNLTYLSRLSNDKYISKLTSAYAYKNIMNTASAVTTDKNEGRRAYQNASEQTLTGTNYSATISAISFALFSFSDQATQDTKSRIYTMRAYDRALSAEEIAMNYAVDKRRFNLS